MENNELYSEWRKKQNIKAFKLVNKEKYYTDLMNIEHSWTGRMDVYSIGNTFIMEAIQQLMNAMDIFELGYFDCAYFSLRSAIDISTTMIFLADMPEDERDKYLQSWKNTETFPLQGQMIKLLSDKGSVFRDMKEKMAEFFQDAKVLSTKINKCVHKQGLKYFYVARSNPFNKDSSREKFSADFEDSLKRCISIVAVMRLAIDPFPVLLMDENILLRAFDSMTEPYNQDFVDEYIGNRIIAAYKTTEIFL